MEWQESTDETPQANSNTRTETVPNMVVARNYLELYSSLPDKTTAARAKQLEK